MTTASHLNLAYDAFQRTRIKICGLTREQDVDAAVAAGADAVGFVLYERSPRFVSPVRAAQLARRLPPFVMPVLLFVNETKSGVLSACKQVPGAMIQFHGDETAKQCTQLALQAGRPYIRAAHIPDNGLAFDLVKFSQEYSSAHAILLDAQVAGYGGGGKVFNWAQLSANAPAHLVLSGGLSAANVTDGIAHVRPLVQSGKTLAVDVSTGVEAAALDGNVQKGIKDPIKIHQFVAAVRTADSLLAK